MPQTVLADLGWMPLWKACRFTSCRQGLNVGHEFSFRSWSTLAPNDKAVPFPGGVASLSGVGHGSFDVRPLAANGHFLETKSTFLN